MRGDLGVCGLSLLFLPPENFCSTKTLDITMHNSIEDYDIKRLDNDGIVAGVIKDLKIVEMIDERLGTYEDETLSAGETVAGMI